MKIACSSASFAREIERGELTQLEWLDLCANELELDGVVFDAAHFPRTDADYLAQLKKTSADLGLSVAAFAADDALAAHGAPSALDVALALGSPLVLVRAPPAARDAGAWGAFTDALKTLAGAAKVANVTLALRNSPGTLCAAPVDLRFAAKDVDSAWLRFGLDLKTLGPADVDAGLLAKTAIATYAIDPLETFATAADAASLELTARLQRFRGFLVLDATLERPSRTAFHEALWRYAAQRANALAASVR